MAREKFRGVRWPVSSAVGIGRVLTPIRRKNPDTEPRVSRSKVKGKTCLSTAVLVRYVKLPGLGSGAMPLESAEEDFRPIGRPAWRLVSVGAESS
jgi:hypothetical protein